MYYCACISIREAPLVEAIQFEPPAFTPPPTEGIPGPPRLIRGPEETEVRPEGRRPARFDDVEPVNRCPAKNITVHEKHNEQKSCKKS